MLTAAHAAYAGVRKGYDQIRHLALHRASDRDLKRFLSRRLFCLQN